MIIAFGCHYSSPYRGGVRTGATGAIAPVNFENFDKIPVLEEISKMSQELTKLVTFYFDKKRNHCRVSMCDTVIEYIFPLPRNAFPREGTGVKTDFFFREKVSLSAVVGKKDGCLTDRSSCLPERSEGRQRREVRQSFRPETKERETFSRKRKRSDRTISLPGKRFLSRGMHFLS